MSLVNLGNVCSHLQNASLARLGLTSIPYTKLHLSLALLLHRQGFLSQVKVAGRSPPASCFPAAFPDNHRITAAPHRDRSPLSAEAALADLVLHHKTVDQLREAGYPEDTIAFAKQARELSKEQLEKDGWDLYAIDFAMEHGHKSDQELEEEGFTDDALAIARRMRTHMQEAQDAFRQELRRPDAPKEEELDQTYIAQRIRAQLKRTGFSKKTLQYFAGPAKYATARHIERDGVTVSAMGVEIPNQPVTMLPEQYRDPWDEETEGVITPFNRASRRLWLGLKYWDGQPVLRKARLISKPTKRYWLGVDDLDKLIHGRSAGEVKGMRQIGEIMAISTDKGVMDARECVERSIGGLPLCRIW
jgi:ribosomal protein S8